MPSRNTIEIVIQGEDKASKVIGHVNQSLDTLGKFALGAVIGGVAAATTAVVGFGTRAIAEFAEFEKGMAETFKLLPDLSKEAMLQMEEDVQHLAARYGQLPTDVAAGIASAIGAGVDVSQINAFMNTAAQAAVAGSTDIQTAVDGLTSVVNAYGAEVIDAAKASDIMFKTVDLGKVEFSELSRFLFNVIPTASALGLAFEDVGAAIALLTSQGTPASVATTQIRQLLVELQKPTTEVSKLFEQMAGVSFPEFIKQGGNLSEALDMIRKGADDSGVELASVFGSVEALNAFLGLSGPNAEKYAGFIEEMGGAAGSTARAFEVMQKTISFQSARVQAKLSNLFINVGRKFEPFAAEVAENIGNAIGILDDFLSGDSNVFDDLEAYDAGTRWIVAFLAPFKPAFDTLQQIFGAFFQNLGSTALGDNIRVTINALLSAFAPEALEPVNNFINAIISIGQEISKVLEPITKWVSENVKLSDVLTVIGVAIASVVLPAIVSIIAAIVSFAAPIIALIGAVALLRTAWENDFGGIRTFVIDKVIPALQQLADWFLTTALPAIVNFIQTQAIPFFERIATTIGQIWELVRPGLESLRDWFLNSAFPAIVDFIQNQAIPFFERIGETLSQIWQIAQPALESLANFIGQVLQVAFEGIVGFWNNIFLPAIQVIIDIIEDLLVPAFEFVVGIIIDVVEAAFQNLVNMWETIFLPAINTVIDILKGIWEAIRPGIEALKTNLEVIFNFIKDNIIQPVIDVIKSIPETINNIKAEVERVAGEIFNTISQINLNPFTGSGFLAQSPLGFANGLEYVDRDRIVKVHKGESILTADETEARMNGAGGNTNNVTINLSGNYRNQNEANRDVDMLTNALKLKGIQLSRA